MRKFILNTGKLGRWDKAFGIFLICLFLFLSVRALDEDRWSDWGFGDAQSMLSLKHWEEGGWIFNKLLFIPQGYAKAIYLLDEPELSQHAHGINPGVSKRVGPKLRYTHYPPGYLIPYAILFRIGLDGIFYQRLLSILFSLGALTLMYAVFYRITSRRVAFVAAMFYGLTPAFLGYADTIANQPIDDLLRFAFMLMVVLSTRSESSDRKRLFMISAWIFEFMLSLSSFDSVFFMFSWLIVWDLLEKRGFNWKTYLVYGLAPITAHSLQFFQNVWYLSFDGAIMDIKDTFLLKSGADVDYNVMHGAGQGWGVTMLQTINILFENLFNPNVLIVVLLGFYIVYMWFMKDRSDRELPSLSLLSGLFICALVFIMILPHAARMPYEARQMLPFAALLVSGFFWSTIKEFRSGLLPGEGDGPEESLCRKVLRLVYVFLSFVLIVSAGYLFMLNERKPVYFIPDEETDKIFASGIESMQKYDLIRFRTLRGDALFAKELKKMPTLSEPVIFNIRGFEIMWQQDYVPGYPQIMPLTEYYTGSRPILCFLRTEDLVRDLISLIRRSPYRFSPIIVADNQANIDDILSILVREGVLRKAPPGAYLIMGRYVVDLTYYLNWEMISGRQ